MKKFILTALMGASTLAFAAGAMAEGTSALQSKTQLNSDAAASAGDNSVARGTVHVNDATDTISATSSTGTKAGTASGSVTMDNSANGINAEGQVGYKQGDDEATRASANANVDADANKPASEIAEERAQINEDLTTKTGVMKTRAKGAMGMLSADEVRTVQKNLISAGYSVKADGVLGANTKQALKEYQKSKNLTATGDIDADTRASFGMDNN